MEKILFLDANVILRFLIYDEINPHFSQAAKKIFYDLEEEVFQAYTSHLVIAEVIFVLESLFKKSKKEIAGYLRPLCQLSALIIPDKKIILSSLNLYVEKNVDFIDAHSYFTMQSQDIQEILTFDSKHFNRFEGIKISKKTHI